MESDELLDEAQRAQRRCKLAESRISVLQAGERRGPKPAQREQYQTALKGIKASRERLAGYSVADVEAIWVQSKKRTAQIRALLDQQLATAAELDDALLREQDALTNVKSAREHWSRLKQEADVADSQLRIARTEPGRDPDFLISAQVELEDAREALKKTKLKEKAKDLTARRAGTVIRVEAHAGDQVLAGETLFQIADLSELSFEVPVSAGVAQQVQPGRAVVVRIPTDPPRRQPASVSSVLLSPDQDHASYVVRVNIPNPSPAAILVGLEGAVEFSHLVGHFGDRFGEHFGDQWKTRPSY